MVLYPVRKGPPVSERRFFVEPDAVGPDRIALVPSVLRHIAKVLRLAAGDEVLILDGLGNHYRACLETVSGDKGSARIVEQWQAGEAVLPVRLIQALPKGDKFDLVLQKGTELGISRFSPVWSERSIPAISRQRKANKLQRWNRIVAESARQSRRPILPDCDEPLMLGQALKTCREELRLMLWEEGSSPLAGYLPESPPADVAILVGPEGGFSREEAEWAQDAGFRPVSLGPRILRTETAGFAVTAVLEYLYGDFGQGNNAPT